MKNDGYCEYIDDEGIRCDAESDVADKDGNNYCMDHYRYVRDGMRAKKTRKKRYTKK